MVSLSQKPFQIYLEGLFWYNRLMKYKRSSNRTPWYQSFLLVVFIALTLSGVFFDSLWRSFEDIQMQLQTAIFSDVLVSLTNETRIDLDLATLKTDPLLEIAAKLKAEDMASKGYFAHTSPEGLNPWYWFQLVGYDYRYAGENLAVNFAESEDVHDAWLNSASHRANIVNGNYTDIGIATARGIYKGREAEFVVQLFGTRKIADYQ